MYTFIGGLLVFLAGYFFFSKYVERQLNIAGLGPIFGDIWGGLLKHLLW